jgi:two-component system phosphate regulon sensor histidine kinase PhoR
MIETGMAKPEDVPLFAKRIRSEAGRLLHLISDILQLSRLDEGAIGEMNETLDLAKIAEECIDTLTLAADKRNISMYIVGEPLIVEGERSMLTELVFNLCDNAIRYNKEGGTLTVRTEGRSLIVEDTGIGIAEENIPHLFERFFRVDKSRSRETGGTGLGLAIVKHIARRHGAVIRVKSSLGLGTAISVTFPDEAV